MKRILVPTDFDESSTNALKLATALTEKDKGLVCVLRVVKTHGGAYFNSQGEIVEDHAYDVQNYKDQMTSDIAKTEAWTKEINPNAIYEVKYGGISDVIIETSDLYKTDLILLGNPQKNRTDVPFFGDLTSHLIKRSSVPILSFNEEKDPNQIDSIVFANEFDGKLAFFDALKELQMYSGAKLNFLRINVNGNIPEEEIKKNMDAFAKANMISDYEKHIVIADEIEAGILKWLNEHPHDILAIKNVTDGLPLFRPKIRQEFVRNMNISTLIYND